MREIKFRAWDDESEHMGYSDRQEDYDDYSFQLNAEVLKVYVFFLEPATFHEPSYTSSREVTEIMQYTGLKDKHGKEIYEGDILELNNDDAFHGDIYKVGWYQKECFLGLFDKNGDCPFNLIDEDCHMWKIIGNIYENPELLKE